MGLQCSVLIVIDCSSLTLMCVWLGVYRINLSIGVLYCFAVCVCVLLYCIVVSRRSSVCMLWWCLGRGCIHNVLIPTRCGVFTGMPLYDNACSCKGMSRVLKRCACSVIVMHGLVCIDLDCPCLTLCGMLLCCMVCIIWLCIAMHAISLFMWCIVLLRRMRYCIACGLCCRLMSCHAMDHHVMPYHVLSGVGLSCMCVHGIAPHSVVLYCII